jgi:hypothetical protein
VLEAASDEGENKLLWLVQIKILFQQTLLAQGRLFQTLLYIIMAGRANAPPCHKLWYIEVKQIVCS